MTRCVGKNLALLFFSVGILWGGKNKCAKCGELEWPYSACRERWQYEKLGIL